MNHQSTISSIRYSQVRLLQTTQCYSEYFAIQVQSKREVKLKIQNCVNSNRLQEEAEYLLLIQDIQGIPEVVDYGFNKNHRFFLATEKLGSTLASLIDMSKTFTLKNVLLIGVKMIQILQSIHERNLIHNKISPNSIHIGLKKESNQVYISDFILMNFKNTCSGELTEQDRDWNFTSYKLMTLNNTSFGDDLESLGYLLIYLLQGKLPWNVSNVGISFPEIKQLQQSKLKYIKNRSLLSQLPINFNSWFDHLLNLKSDEQPNYSYLKNIFAEILKQNGWKMDEKIEFDMENETRARSLSSLQIKSNQKLKSSRSPQSLKKEYLSPIEEIDKDFDISITFQGQKITGQVAHETNQNINYKGNLKQLSVFNQLKGTLEEEDFCDPNMSLVLDEQNECEIWTKLEGLSKQEKSCKSISNLLELF